MSFTLVNGHPGPRPRVAVPINVVNRNGHPSKPEPYPAGLFTQRPGPWFREVVRELLTREEIGLSSENTACNYVTSWLGDCPAAVVTEFDGRVVVGT